MKMRPGVFAALVAGMVCMPLGSYAAGSADGQSFTGAGTLPGVDGAPAAVPESNAQAGNNLASNDPASKLCADGTRAIDQGRWADAVRIFTQVAGQHGDHSDAALYWKAYAENKLGQVKQSKTSCAELRGNYPKSRWIEDCGALEVEIQAKSGEKVTIEPGQSDDVKLLALNAMMRQNEPLALAEIQEILNGDSSEKLKKEAEFILGNHYSDTTYAQIVRISYVEGDVRIQRGEPNGKSGSAIWEKAIADLPVETGFSIATGAGRAEIEFENASTIYLGENSVLTFNDLHETAGVPFTELGLLSGTVSLNFHPYTAREKMILHTPTNDLVSRYPDRTYARVEAFTDAVTITPLAGGDVRLPGVAKDATVPGRTFTWLQGQLVDADTPAGKQLLAARETDNDAAAAWDKWVAGRVAQRETAVNAVMEEAGLTAPIPGMADLAGQGKFFDCAPYGTCWEPNEQAERDAKDANQQSLTMPAQGARLELAAYHPSGFNGQAVAGDPLGLFDREYDFPCTPYALRWRLVRDPVTGQQVVVSNGVGQARPYDWAVCHAGSWIRHRHHYVWVAGGKRRHAPPVRWVKSGHKLAFVPLHPYDVKGRPAINVKHEVFEVSGSKSKIVIEPVKLDPNSRIEFLKEPPKEYSTAALRPLTAVEIPRMMAHTFPRATGVKGAQVASAAIPIHFDAKTQSFMLPHQQTIGGKTSTVFAPMSNRSGSLQARGATFSGSSGFHGGSNGGSAGGGSRASSGGGGASAGGGSHGGGGGGGLSGGGAVSSSSAASSASSAGSSGGHH
jgi:hypothetical protein